MTDFERKTNYINKLPTVGLSIINSLLGKFIGSGISREVYEYGIDDKWVIKVERRGKDDSGEGDNWIEWRIWHNVKYTTDGTKEWFAECGWISDCGTVMIQKKTKPLYTKENKIPEKIPSYFTDIKSDNFGWIGNNLVCHDYSMCLERFGYFALGNKMQNFKNKL